MSELWIRGRVIMATLSDLAALVGASVLVIGSSSAIVGAFLSGYIGIAFASLFSGATVLGLMIGARIWRHRRRSRKTDWNPSIWMRTRQGRALVKSASEVHYEHAIELIILRDDISRFNWRVGWTGVGDLSISIKNAGFTWSLVPAPTDSAHILVIHFDRPRGRGDVIPLEFGISAIGTERPQEPFYSVTLFESRIPKEATIQVEFADGIVVKSVQREMYASDTAPWPMEPPTPLSLDRNRIIEWPLPRKAGRRYGIRWELG